jgi:hypothetical protein
MEAGNAGEWRELPNQCKHGRPGYLVNRAACRFMRLTCDKWACDACGRYKARRVAKRFRLLQPNWMITFTLAGDQGEPTAENEVRSKLQIRTFVNWMRRQPWGLAIKGGWVRELGEEHGRLHFHALFRINPRVVMLPFRRMQRIAHRLGLGTLDCKRVWREQGAARYVAKYLTKSLSDDAQARGLRGRRFAMSPGYNLEPNPQWQFERVYPGEIPGSTWACPENYLASWGQLVAEMLAGPPAQCSAVFRPTG